MVPEIVNKAVITFRVDNHITTEYYKHGAIVTLPRVTYNTYRYSGWTINGTGETFEGDYTVNTDITFVANILNVEDTLWTGMTSFSGNYIWTDGENTYYSNGSKHYVLTSEDAWQQIMWSGLTSFSGGYIWTDGNYVYYSNVYEQYTICPIVKS